MKKQIMFSSEHAQVYQISESNRVFVRKVIPCPDPERVVSNLESLIIEHPNICKIYEVRVKRDAFEIDMEFLDGIPLADYLKSAGTVSRLRIAKQLISLVRALYGIQHPYSFVQNNFWVCNGTLKLIGFGVHNHCFANESEIARLILTPYFPGKVIMWWFDRITSRCGSRKITYLTAFTRYLTFYRWYYQSRVGILICASLFTILSVFYKIPDRLSPKIQRVVIMDDAELNVYDMYAHLIQQQRINVIPSNDVQLYLKENQSVSPMELLRYFSSQALVYVNVEKDPWSVTSRLVYLDGREKTIHDNYLADQEALFNHHFVRVLSALTQSPAHEVLPVLEDAYTVQTYLYGVYTYNLKGAQDALPYFEICMKSNPNFHYAYLKYAKCLRNLGQYTEATEILNQVLDRPDIDSYVELMCWSLLASVASQLKDYEVALEQYERALAVSHTVNDDLLIARMLNNIGSMLYRQKRYADSRVYFQDSFRLKQGLGEWQGISTLYNSALVAIEESNYESAETEMQQVLQLSTLYRDHKHVASSMLALGWLAHLQDQHVQARTQIQAALHIAEQYGIDYLKIECLNRLASIGE